MSKTRIFNPITSLRGVRGASIVKMNKNNCIALSFLIECAAHSAEERGCSLIAGEYLALAAEWRLLSETR